MARKYTRDNRGRFASGGGGATARGGRLKTAAGNKRKTQTMKAAGASGAGVIKGKVTRDPRAAGRIMKAAQAPSIQASGRTRAEAASAQRQRSRATIEATRGQVIGRQRRVTATAGGGEKVRVRRAAVEQGSIFGGSDVVRKAVATRVAASKGPAPGSKAARSAAGKTLRAKETPAQRLGRVGRRAGISDSGKGPEARRKAAKGFSARSPKKMAQAVKTGAKARTYVIRQKEKVRS